MEIQNRKISISEAVEIAPNEVNKEVSYPRASRQISRKLLGLASVYGGTEKPAIE